MLFNSLAFLLFLPIVLIGYHFLKSFRVTFLLAASYFFIAWWKWEYLSLVVISTLIDFTVSRKLGRATNGLHRQLLLATSLATNLGLLLFFKYFNFFNHQVESFFEMLGLTYMIPYSSFLLPMGISFYTFQTLSYTIDVYNRKVHPENDFKTFALFVSFFPQLVAGPIERAGSLIQQLKDLKPFSTENFNAGIGRILIGFFKKLVIADRLALFVDPVFDNPTQYDGSLLILATFFFAFQIYCDFSGYSDIAIGIARLFGVRLMENFKTPYIAKGIREFWSRWHISLSTWFRDYLYIPLGGNRVSQGRLMTNLLIVFLVSGLWHGANWTFMIWGLLHGLALIMGILQTKSAINHAIFRSKIWNTVQIILTFLFVCFAWIFFRSNSVSDAFYIATAIFKIDPLIIKDLLYTIKSTIVNPIQFFERLNFDYGRVLFQMTKGDFVMSLVLIPSLFGLEILQQRDFISFRKLPRFLIFYLLIISIILFGVFTQNQFIYFQF